ncbi:SMP-30/gluconolactonase/LRE family protein [Fulvitalea axinellae]
MKKTWILALGLAGTLWACSESSSDTLPRSTDFTGPVFTQGAEGPAVRSDGVLFSLNFEKSGTVGQVDDKGNVSLFLQLPGDSHGNGTRFDSKGNMLIADQPGHRILKVDANTKDVSVYAEFGGPNEPNDIAIMDNDIIFVADPFFQAGTGRLWRVLTDGTVKLMDEELDAVNGIEVSPDNRTLYVNTTNTRKLLAYDLDENGNLSNKRLLLTFPDYALDGMRCDEDGHLWIARWEKGTVVYVSPNGLIIKEVRTTGKRPSNVAFGGKDGKTLFITEQERGVIEQFRVDVPGRNFKLSQQRQ